MSVTKAILSAPWISAGVALAAFIVYALLIFLSAPETTGLISHPVDTVYWRTMVLFLVEASSRTYLLPVAAIGLLDISLNVSA